MQGVNGGSFDAIGNEVCITFQGGVIKTLPRLHFENFVERGYGKLPLEEGLIFARLLPGRLLHIIFGNDEIKLVEQILLHQELRL